MLTILETAKLTPNPLRDGVVEIIAGNNPVLEVLPFINMGGSAYLYNREGVLPGTAFRALNENYAESTGEIVPENEPLTIFGGHSDYDVAAVKWNQGSSNDLRATHDAMKAKSASLTWLKNFFDGDKSSDAKGFNGLNVRLAANGQVKQANSGGQTLTLDLLDQVIDLVNGTPNILLMNKTMRRKITKLAQNTATVQLTQDALGRPAISYAGIPIGVVEDDATGTAILGFDEDDGQSNFDTTSIYAARVGLDSMHGIQTEPLEVRDLGRLPTSPHLRTEIEWLQSWVLAHPKAAARLSRINNA
jgi:hypothetical protein